MRERSLGGDGDEGAELGDGVAELAADAADGVLLELVARRLERER
jgi:hypothetical protein